MAFPLTITAWTVLILGTIFVLQTFNVVAYRRKEGIVLGDAEDRTMLKRIRGHANMAEQLPLAIILLGLAEWMHGFWVALILAVLFVVGRSLHALYFGKDGTHWRFRFYGMILTMLGQISGLIAVFIGLLF